MSGRHLADWTKMEITRSTESNLRVTFVVDYTMNDFEMITCPGVTPNRQLLVKVNVF